MSSHGTPFEEIKVRCGSGTLFRTLVGNFFADPQDYQVNDDGSAHNFWSASIPANTLQDYGDCLHVVMFGQIGSTTNNHYVSLSLGSVSMFVSPAMTTANGYWQLEMRVFKDAANSGNSIRATGLWWDTTNGTKPIRLASTNLTLSSNQNLVAAAQGDSGGGTSWTKEYSSICNYIKRGELTP